MRYFRTVLATFSLMLLTTNVFAAASVTPISGAPYLIISNYDLGKLGYTVEEYFISGEATSYKPVGELGSDGHWTLAPATKAPFKTRVVVIRPTSAAKANGSAFVEWLNVSAGGDIAPDWL